MNCKGLLAIIALTFSTQALSACFSQRLGYPCCSSGIGTVYTDNDGDWGVENGDWCGIDKSSSQGCWAAGLGYSCCQNTKDVYYEDADGKWGVENNEWCGIIEGGQIKTTTTVKKTTTTTTVKPTPTVDDNVPPKPPLSDWQNARDPAANCDISDSIRGDSLAKSAPYRVGVGIYGVTKENANVMSKKMRELIKYQFNSVTYTNLMKAEFMLDAAKCRANAQKGIDLPVLKFDTIVDGLEYCKENGIKMRGHTLVWHTQTPDWYFRDGFNTNGSYVSSDRMAKRMESYIQQMFAFLNKYYPGVIDVWDVVNEAVEDNAGSYDASSGWNTRTRWDGKENPWYKVMGPNYVITAFRLARKYAPAGVKLIYNDYNTFTSVKNAAIIRLLNVLKKENLVDGVGMQSYLNQGWPNPNDYKNAIMNFSKTGLDIQITELTIKADINSQGQQYKQVFQIYEDCMKAGAKITSVTVFGLSDNYLFYDNDQTNTRLWDRNLRKKPAFNNIMQVLKN